jgi:nucleotide-binding universal stress UspA family protein
MQQSILPDISSAVQDFHRARSKAMMKAIIARITGESIQLLSYDEVRKRLHAQNIADRGLKEIPLDSIVGSLGRYNDFTRDFLPLRDSIKDRWTRVQVVATGLVGLPPIDVYQIGEVYFVKDGNHRISVARQLGAIYIQAYVTEVKVRVPLKPDDDPTEIIVKSEYSAFLEKTHLDELRPDSDLLVSIPGKYEELEEHISVHRYYMGIDQNREIPYSEAALHWYDTIYVPVIAAIREQGILRNFPERTEADLYLWISNHRASLEHELGWQLEPDTAARLLVNRFDNSLRAVFNRFNDKFFNFLTRGKLSSGPPPGQWRKETITTHASDQLIKEMLVPIRSLEHGWSALDQAIIIANRENALIHGLHVTAETDHDENKDIIQQEFKRRCLEAGVKGDLVYAQGAITNEICRRAIATDLVITTLNYPPGPQPLDRLESGFHDLIQKCPRPIFAIPHRFTRLQRGLLAFDGSPKAEEALFISTYMAAKWGVMFSIISAAESKSKTSNILNRADGYMTEHGISPHLIPKRGSTSQAILETCKEINCDFIVMGGYGYSPILEVMIGSTVDKILRETNIPVLVCR